MTKRDFYAKVIAAAIDAELTEFAKAEIEKLDKENAKRREKTAAKAAENQPLLDEIYNNILTEDPMSASDVAAMLDGVSVQKVSYLLRTLVAQEKVVQSELSVKGKGKVKGYAKV